MTNATRLPKLHGGNAGYCHIVKMDLVIELCTMSGQVAFFIARLVAMTKDMTVNHHSH